jgi:hypothetical protein
MKSIILEILDMPSFKITIEEINPDKYICTYWNKSDCFEIDRHVVEFETRGGATSLGFQLLSDIIKNDLKT